MGKKTTTLTLDSETVEKAKKMNINISELTDTVLKGFTFEPDDIEDKALNDKYNELFNAIRPILKQQNISVEVGTLWSPVTFKDSDGKEHTDYEPDETIFLHSDGTLYLSESNAFLKDMINENISRATPKQILSNLIEAMDKRKERRKEEITEIEMVKRIIEVLYPTFAKK